MDIIRLLRSLEEFLYELAGWIIFYPRTFWRILCAPGRIALYTRQELSKAPQAQFADAISPVLMLILSVVLAHAMEMALKVPAPSSTTPLGRMLFGSEQGMLLSRAAVFSFVALGAALGTLIRQRRALNRETLRGPFAVQAYLVCPLVLVLSLGEVLARRSPGSWAGTIIMAGAVLWYLAARMLAYRAVSAAPWRSAVAWVLGAFVMTTAVIGLVFLGLLH